MTEQRIAVVGTGANGASIGADMIRGGLDVTFIEQWPAHVEAMRERGIRVELPGGEHHTTPVPVYHLCQVAEMRQPFDLVFVGVKAYDTRWACELMKPLVASDGLVVGLQNGITIDDVADIVGPERTVGAVLGIASNMFTPGLVERQTAPADTWFAVGGYDESTQERVKVVVESLSHSGAVELSDDIRAAKWMKLIANAPELVPSAILGLPLLEAASVPAMRPVMDEAAREAYRLAVALGIEIVPIFGKTADEVAESDDYAVALFDEVLTSYSLPDTKVAVLQDWLKGRRGEVDDINGYVVRRRAAIGGEAPVNARIVAVAHRIEAGELDPDPANVDLLVEALVG